MRYLIFTISLLVSLDLSSYSLNWEPFYEKARDEIKSIPDNTLMGVSLGINCNIASRFAEYKIRTFAFPFDWLITPAESLHALIENNFDDFLNLRNFRIIDEKVLLDQKYQLKFHHDMDGRKWRNRKRGISPVKGSDAVNDYRDMYAQFGRRIARFYALMDSDLPIYLMRRDITKEQALSLHSMLRKKFPRANFTLVCLEWKENGLDEDWGINGIMHFSIGRDGKNPAFPHPDYDRIFLTLGLITEPKFPISETIK